MKRKYRNRKITRNGESFDSIKEYQRFCELSLLEKAGTIQNLKRQVKFELIPVQRNKGKCIERAVSYVADFTYFKNDQLIVEDVKGYKKGSAYALFTLKRKLMLYIHGIRIREV